MSYTYNLDQSKKLLQADQKTFKKWLAKAKMTPVQDAYDTRQKLLTYEQLVILADLHDRPRPPLPDETSSAEEVTLATLDKRLAVLEQLIAQRLDALQRELTEIAQMQQTASQGSHAPQTKPSTTPAVLQTPIKKTTTRRRAKKPRAKILPRGFVPLTVFRQEHGISEKAVDYARGKKKFVEEHGKWLYNGKMIMIALSRQGQHEFIEVFHERPEFHRCNTCPHTL